MATIDRKRRNGRCMGIDYGLARVGLAISDPSRTIASPSKTVATEDALVHVKSLVTERDITEIVVGVPLHMDGSMSEMGEEALSFVSQLGAIVDVPVVTRDERLSTVEAERALNAVDSVERRRKRPKGRVDSAAAAIILQSYLDGV
ncbi:MAG: Holliday junction resolvase RuvX [Chloroflexi bacterium]|nr:Holliday junction resolvase RuvX [Chloroflexota bacterium]